MDRQIEALTSLRGIAALIVVVHHFSIYTLPQTGQWLATYGNFFRNGYLSVDFFFMLSGFIMAHVYLAKFADRITRSSYTEYLRARFARIYPLHLFTLLLLVGLEFIKLWTGQGAFTGKFNLTALGANVLLLQAFDLTCPPLLACQTYWNEPAWSISVEFIIYTVFPWLLFWLLKIKPRYDWMIYLGSLLSLLLLIKVTRGNLDAIIGIPAIARCGLECIIGIITYKIRQRNIGNKYSGLLATIALIWILGIMHNWTDTARGIHDWSILPAFSLLILAVSGSRANWLARILQIKPLIYLGTISYSVYLLHWCLAEGLKLGWQLQFGVVFGANWPIGQSLLVLLLLISVCLLLAVATYRWIEVPMRQRLRGRIAAM
jgi:peptidoglycan/LPS O-acetylase OafA/YrhL